MGVPDLLFTICSSDLDSFFFRLGKKCGSVAGFFLVAESKHKLSVQFHVVAIESNIAGVPEANDQFTKGWMVGKRPADTRVRFKEYELSPDSLSASPRRLRILFC